MSQSHGGAGITTRGESSVFIIHLLDRGMQLIQDGNTHGGRMPYIGVKATLKIYGLFMGFITNMTFLKQHHLRKPILCSAVLLMGGFNYENKIISSIIIIISIANCLRLYSRVACRASKS